MGSWQKQGEDLTTKLSHHSPFINFLTGLIVIFVVDLTVTDIFWKLILCQVDSLQIIFPLLLDFFFILLTIHYAEGSEVDIIPFV